MRKTSAISLGIWFFACAHPQPPVVAAVESPQGSYQQIDPDDPSKGYFVSYAAALDILIDRHEQKLACLKTELSLQKQNEFCQAELKDASPNWFSMYAVPVLAALAGAALGAGIGYAAHK